jgi:hypothetical protein
MQVTVFGAPQALPKGSKGSKGGRAMLKKWKLALTELPRRCSHWPAKQGSPRLT